MSIRIRETAGTSWRDPVVPGTRHWRSTSVSFGIGWWILAEPLWYLFVLPFVIFPLWLSIELYVLAISGLIVLFTWLFDDSTRFSTYLDRWHWFWYLTAR